MNFAMMLMALILSTPISTGSCFSHCDAPQTAPIRLVAQNTPAEHPQADPVAPAVAQPSLGIGLSGVTDYATQMPFIDMMKSARVWTGHVGGGWGGMSDKDLREGGYLDSNGWPRAMPPDVTGIATLVLTDLPAEATSANGRYRLRYEGQGLVEISSGGKTVAGSRGEAWFTAEAGTGAVTLTIIRTDPNKNGEYLRNFTIVKEENIAAFDAGEIFNPLWIERIGDMRALRFMDWMMTNDSTNSAWSARSQVGDYTYADHGVPLEIMIRLSNEVGADPWFTLPHLATDDYIRQFATLVHDQLDPRLKAHVELSNEVWNWQFSQAHWAEQGGRERWHADNKWVQFYAMRASQMAAVWDDVYGDEAEERLVKVISTQTGWLGLEEDILNAPLWVAEAADNRPPYSYFDAYAITGYFSGKLGSEDAPLVLQWIAESREHAVTEAQQLAEELRADYIAAHQYDLAVRRAAQQLADGSITGDETGTVKSLVQSDFAYHAAVAQKYDLDLIMYEGGTHVTGMGEWIDNAELNAFFSIFNYSPEMGALYTEVMNGWKAAGGTLFNVFVDVYPSGKWGSWGALRHLTDSNPRWDAIQEFNANTVAWWEERAPGTFDGSDR